MLKREYIEEILSAVRTHLFSLRGKDGMWRGMLSSSAISTSVSVFALHMIDSRRYADSIEKGANWLVDTMNADGSWGDSIESPSNMTATLLSYTSLYALGRAPQESRRYLAGKFGGDDEESIVNGVLKYYGKDLTFSVPILCMCALSGVIGSWERIPPFPFELAILPQRLFRFLNLPVVSYAIPALIAIGILQLRMKHSADSLISRMREPFVKRTLGKLITLQPEDGGFLEAAPLTAFVSMCLSAAGYREHEVTCRAASFLTATQREDGAWPIDTDLAGWVTSLASVALADDLRDREALAALIRSNATREVHPFTGAPAGGWGWTNLSGSVPDGDDTSGALVALHALTGGVYCDEVGGGLQWLMSLQNNDGGMPTFCKGWGRLPFDRSSPDITAHAALAMGLWLPVLPKELKRRCTCHFHHLLLWLERNKSREGMVYWTPLWFGDQDAKDERSHVYGTATLMDYLNRLDNPRARAIASDGVRYLLASQNADGGWGGQRGIASKVTLTAKALTALSHYEGEDVEKALEKGLHYIYIRYREGTLFSLEPIGLYFARLWYSERMYSPCYLAMALKRLIARIENEERKRYDEQK